MFASLTVDGRRVFLWSGEFHPFRLPSPSLWLDILEKMKANGYNAVSAYFDWGYHSSAPGVYDFTGVRDVDKLLDICDNILFRAFCPLGDGATSCITSAVQYFRTEFEAGMHTPASVLFPPAASTLFAKETVSA